MNNQHAHVFICSNTFPYRTGHKTPLLLALEAAFGSRCALLYEDTTKTLTWIMPRWQIPIRLSFLAATPRTRLQESGSCACSGKSFGSQPRGPDAGAQHLLTCTRACLLLHTLLRYNDVKPVTTPPHLALTPCGSPSIKWRRSSFGILWCAGWRWRTLRPGALAGLFCRRCLAHVFVL